MRRVNIERTEITERRAWVRYENRPMPSIPGAKIEFCKLKRWQKTGHVPRMRNQNNFDGLISNVGM